MDTDFIVALGLLVYVRSALTLSESVWLNDVTDRFLTPKRVFDDPDLPDELSFHIRRRSGDLTLKLKRNYEIDPNAEIYFVKKTADGRSIKSKSSPLEMEALAYYQDVDNGAYMTVRCINSLNKRCERSISGNLQIGERSYDLRPAGTDNKRRNVIDVTDVIGRRYLLLDQTNILQEKGVEHKDANELKEPFEWYNPDKKQNDIDMSDDTLSFRNLADLPDIEAPDTIRQLKKNYYVKVAVCIDSGIWDLYSSQVKDVHSSGKVDEVKRRIREAYSHIVNGVNLRYKTINDPSISISVIPSEFVFFMNDAMFPHIRSKLISLNGSKYLEARPYLDDFFDWDRNTRANDVTTFDHAMLFTVHKFHLGSDFKSLTRGLSILNGVCDLGKRSSIIHARDYVWTVQTATHELGHNLGAHHDGEGEAAACKSEDSFIMTVHNPQISKNKTHIANMWRFSTCSVESFKKTLQNKECVKRPGTPYDVNEYTMLMRKPAGYVFTPQEQCLLSYGPDYVFYGTVTEDICYRLSCANRVTRIKKKIYVHAARGTKCGDNKWCIEGLCVARSVR